MPNDLITRAHSDVLVITADEMERGHIECNGHDDDEPLDVADMVDDEIEYAEFPTRRIARLAAKRTVVENGKSRQMRLAEYLDDVADRRDHLLDHLLHLRAIKRIEEQNAKAKE